MGRLQQSQKKENRPEAYANVDSPRIGTWFGPDII